LHLSLFFTMHNPGFGIKEREKRKERHSSKGKCETKALPHFKLESFSSLQLGVNTILNCLFYGTAARQRDKEAMALNIVHSNVVE